jgi:hypothetical protein
VTFFIDAKSTTQARESIEGIRTNATAMKERRRIAAPNIYLPGCSRAIKFQALLPGALSLHSQTVFPNVDDIFEPLFACLKMIAERYFMGISSIMGLFNCIFR